jgi:hypothetical protein
MAIRWDTILQSGYCGPNALTANDLYHAIKDRLAEEAKSKTRKPPLGIMPRKLWEEHRKQEVYDTVARYLIDGWEVPDLLMEEYIVLFRPERRQ